MAGLVVVAGMVLIDKHRAKKEARAQKLLYDEERYADLERETRKRLTQAPSSNATRAGHVRFMSEDSTFDSVYYEKKMASLENNELKKSRRPKWWSLRPGARRTRSTS